MAGTMSMTATPATISNLDFVKVLAFGASLTEGYYNRGHKFHPYAIELEKCINKHYTDKGSDNHAAIHQFGLSGEFTSHMIPRLHDILTKSATSPYKFVCILAGTNDLSLSDSGDEIFERLRQLYNMVLEHGDKQAILVAITIPQSFFTDSDYVGTRNTVNKHIKNFCLGINKDSDQVRVITVDYENLIPYQENGIYWDDALHMTPAGYNRLGKFIFEHISHAL